VLSEFVRGDLAWGFYEDVVARGLQTTFPHTLV
jgi:hypothetical protein